MILALLNDSKRYQSADGAKTLGAIATAVNRQLHSHAAPLWHMTAWNCVYYPDEAHTPPEASRLWVLDNPDVANALGYHDVDPHGHTYSRVFVEPILDNGGSDFTGATSVSTTVSHEALEAWGDPAASYWAQMPDGRLTALELCDAVEADTYPTLVKSFGHVSLSNFVLPAWFREEENANRFDYMNTLREPFTMSPGGYMILMKSGRVSQVFAAEYPMWKLAGKSHPAARTATRHSA